MPPDSPFVAVDTPRSDTATTVGTLPDIDKGPDIAMADKGLDTVEVGTVARKTSRRARCSMAVDTQGTKGSRRVGSRRLVDNCN